MMNMRSGVGVLVRRKNDRQNINDTLVLVAL